MNLSDEEQCKAEHHRKPNGARTRKKIRTIRKKRSESSFSSTEHVQVRMSIASDALDPKPSEVNSDEEVNMDVS
ncbi:hypothetical protein SARC_01911 [Sphaeroforma arctica JP610]|uniref:Uncharacterized protein n=1 Tax=Sphaeroforma arctica JP610 TaxID=667725 RepID=A0A0L0GCC9_9EUKA|nr:hypothetical protein SARC_01911 [Sphaeroforma arctica JP610]KNC85918.1 hypothetical protein SARC_01911 [Sphaeroforma arctica JP610]|eukprot:XP_014159820.1 hypothetical protein SARC_01911 [Sphaeroforma arctica JP610]